MAARFLTTPYTAFVLESVWLLQEFSDAEKYQNRDPELAALSAQMTIIRLHDAWHRFCREVVISSASELPFTSSGVRVVRAPGISRRADVIPTLLSTFKKRRTEPRWADAADCLDAAKRLSITNFSSFSMAIGAANSPIEEIRVVRNYIAHRSAYTAQQIRASSAFGPTSKLDVWSLAAILIGPNQTRMHQWVSMLHSIANVSIQ